MENNPRASQAERVQQPEISKNKVCDESHSKYFIDIISVLCRSKFMITYTTSTPYLGTGKRHQTKMQHHTIVRKHFFLLNVLNCRRIATYKM